MSVSEYRGVGVYFRVQRVCLFQSTEGVSVSQYRGVGVYFRVQRVCLFQGTEGVFVSEYRGVVSILEYRGCVCFRVQRCGCLF